jgi:hypothetical protein
MSMTVFSSIHHLWTRTEVHHLVHLHAVRREHLLAWPQEGRHLSLKISGGGDLRIWTGIRGLVGILEAVQEGKI